MRLWSFGMRVFISWSGARSKQIGGALYEWLPNVLQFVEPFLSDELEKGIRWSETIALELAKANFGIICVTPENVDAAWLNFEAGALAKIVDDRVAPFLTDLAPSDVVGPLNQFHMTQPNFKDVERLVDSINASSDNPLTALQITSAVKMWWPKLQETLEGIHPPQATVVPDKKRDAEDLIPEILERVRDIQRNSRGADESSFASKRDGGRDEDPLQARLELFDEMVRSEFPVPFNLMMFDSREDLLFYVLDELPPASMVNRIVKLGARFGLRVKVTDDSSDIRGHKHKPQPNQQPLAEHA